jgi:hypothetical protein
MPNGENKNWVRLRKTVDGFYARHGRWPTRVRLGQGELDNLRDQLLSAKRWARIASKLEFTIEADVGFIASDGDDYRIDAEKHDDAERPRCEVAIWVREER